MVADGSIEVIVSALLKSDDLEYWYSYSNAPAAGSHTTFAVQASGLMTEAISGADMAMISSESAVNEKVQGSKWNLLIRLIVYVPGSRLQEWLMKWLPSSSSFDSVLEAEETQLPDLL